MRQSRKVAVTPEGAERPSRFRVRKPVWLAAIWVLMWLNAPWPFLRFTTPSLNHAAFAMAQIIPWLLLHFVFRWGAVRWRKWTLGFPTLLLAILSAPFGLISAGCSIVYLKGDPTVERKTELSAARGTVVVDYIDTGAVGYWGYLVRQQCTIIPGVIAVHDLYQTPDRGLSANVELLDSYRVRIKASYGEGSTPRDVDGVFNLWPLPCLWSRAG